MYSVDDEMKVVYAVKCGNQIRSPPCLEQETLFPPLVIGRQSENELEAA